MTLFIDKITDRTLSDIEYTITASNTPTAYLFWNSTTATIVDSKNISSVADGGVGIFTPTFSVAWINTDYIWLPYIRDNDSGGDGYISQNFGVDLKSTTQILLEINDAGGLAMDTDEINIKVIGEY